MLLTTKKPSNGKILSGYNTVLGPVINLTYYDTALLLAVKNSYVSSLRYPGGTVGNYWSYRNASYVNPCNTSEYNYCYYQERVAKLPNQTFSPGNFTNGVGSNKYCIYNNEINTVMYDLNILTLFNDTLLDQLNVLKEQNVNPMYLELGNEYYFKQIYI